MSARLTPTGGAPPPIKRHAGTELPSDMGYVEPCREKRRSGGHKGARELNEKCAALILPVQPRASKAGTHLGFAKGVALPHGLPVQGFRATWV